MSRSADPLGPELGEEVRALVGPARSLLRELVEEGCELDPTAVAASGSAAEAPPPRARAASEPRPVEPVPPAAPQLGFEDPVPSASLEQVSGALGECTRCRLHEGRTRIVFGDGDPEADLMFIGEAPGEQEDLRGLPFVGRAGELLTKMIEAGLGLSRSQVYICNVVKCRPPGNRTPLADEVSACRPFLDGQIGAVKPRVIVALGKPASSLLLGREVAITRIRGTWHEYRGIPVMPTYHPAYVLRQYTEANRRAVWEDLKAALQRARSPE